MAAHAWLSNLSLSDLDMSSLNCSGRGFLLVFLLLLLQYAAALRLSRPHGWRHMAANLLVDIADSSLLDTFKPQTKPWRDVRNSKNSYKLNLHAGRNLPSSGCC